ncbi:MAG: NACHT domain-containing protein [Bacteroidota bacterium]
MKHLERIEKKLFEISKDISEGKTKEAIDRLLVVTSGVDQKLHHELTLHSGTFAKLSSDKRKGLLSRSEENQETAHIHSSLLEIIETLSIPSPSNQVFEDADELVISAEEDIAIPRTAFKESIDFHLHTINKWSEGIKFRDATNEKSTANIYIHLNFFLTPARLQFEKSIANEQIPFQNLINTTEGHLVILGQPGAGKTTTMKKLIQDVLRLTVHQHGHTFDFPIVIRLRELNAFSVENHTHILFKKILDICGIKEKQIKDSSNQLVVGICKLLEELNILLILDGFDELKHELKEPVLEGISILALSLTTTRFILTSRTGDYYREIPKTTVFEICPLNEDQIQFFVQKWLGSEADANTMLKQISDSPFKDTMIRPLTLAHLCALFERYHRIPAKPKSIYKKTINLLLEEWDLQKSISRKSRYGQFDVDRKFDFLSHLAYQLSTEYRKMIFDSNILKDVYRRICQEYSLPDQDTQVVVDELENHNGIFIQSGYDSYEFAHKSFQEYLAAEYIVKLPGFPPKSDILKLPSEMALAVAISSNPTLYFSDLMLREINQPIDQDLFLSFLKSFFNRLVLEQPDFQLNPLLGASVLYCYALCEKISEGDLQFFNEILNIKKVDQSIKLLSIKNSSVLFTRHHIVSSEY